MKNNLKSGIYRWTNVHNGKVYIGEDKTIIDKTRYKDFVSFGQYKYAGKKINDARKKYNHIEDWEYEVLEYCTPEERFDLEKYWVTWHKENGYTLYNLTEGGDGFGDDFWTEERRKALSEKKMGKCYITIKWTREACYAEAKKYSSRSEFKKGCGSAYEVARLNNWLDDYTWFEEIHKPKGYWDIYENVYNEAKKFDSRRAFKKESPQAYKVACEKDWLRLFDWFPNPRIKWTFKTCYAEARKYNTRNEFKHGNGGAYKKACDEGWIDKFTWFVNVKKPKGYWDIFENVEAEAANYPSRTEFLKKCQIGYNHASKNGWLDKLFPRYVKKVA